MKAPLLFFFWFFCRTSANNRASVIVTPNRAQYFEYDNFSVSCERSDSGEWTVWRYTTDGLKLSQCGSGWGVRTSSSCTLNTVKLSTSGVYWCQSEHSDSSNTVNITVTGDPDHSVILQSPVLPVPQGVDVTLYCKTKKTFTHPSAKFYKDDVPIRTEASGHMTIHHFSKADEGAYKCHIEGFQASPSSWLLMKEESVLVTITASPDTAQWYEYENLVLSCNANSSLQGWIIRRYRTSEGKMSNCGDNWGTPGPSSCSIQTTKVSYSAVYWCESPAKQRSNSINISVYDSNTAVILQSPVLPVMEGHDVTLHCQTKTPPSNLPAAFYKNGSLIRTEPTGHMTIHHVTKSRHEGLYKCSISGSGESPSSWIHVRAKDQPSSPHHQTLPEVYVTVFRHILVCCPYFICTLLMLSALRQKPPGGGLAVSMATLPQHENIDELDPQYDDVIADVTTEHPF